MQLLARLDGGKVAGNTSRAAHPFAVRGQVDAVALVHESYTVRDVLAALASDAFMALRNVSAVRDADGVALVFAPAPRHLVPLGALSREPRYVCAPQADLHLADR